VPLWNAAFLIRDFPPEQRNPPPPTPPLSHPTEAEQKSKTRPDHGGRVDVLHKNPPPIIGGFTTDFSRSSRTRDEVGRTDRAAHFQANGP